MKLPAAPRPAERPAADTPAGLGVGTPSEPPDALFAALLDIQTARTATAEGQTTETPEAPPAASPMDGTVMDELAAAQPAAVPIAPPAQPVPAGDAQPPAPKAQARATPATPAVPGHRDAADPIAKAEPAPRAQPATPAMPATPPAPAKTPPASDERVKPAAREAASTPQAEPVVTPVKERPVVHSASEPRPVLRGERVEALVRVATRHGAAEARMELHPQELGSVVVKLRVTSDGLTATFTASNPEAIPQLQQAGDDLRRSLEAKGLTLVTLEVRAQGDDSGRAGERRHEHRGGHQADRRHAQDSEDEPLTSTTTTVPAGALVDVHA